MKSESKILPVLVFASLVIVNHLTGNMALNVAGWFLKLPNLTYLYVFAWVPIVSYIFLHCFQSQISHNIRAFFSGLLYLSAFVYLIVGAAQLIRMFILPFGLFTLYIAYVFLVRAREIAPEKEVQNVGHIIVLTKALGAVALFICSTVYNQPWSLVFHLPNVQGANLQNYDLSDMHFNMVSFTDSNLEGANFSNSQLIGVKFSDTNLSKAIFYQAKIESSEFTNINMSHSVISNSWLYQTEFSDSDLTGVLFYKTFLGRFFISNSQLCGTKFIELPYPNGLYGARDSVFDKNTIFPVDVDPEEIHAKYTENCN